MIEDEKIINTKEHSYHNEVGLLGAVMRDGSTYNQVREIVTYDCFGWLPYSWVWSAFEQLHSNGMSIDTITVGDELERTGKIEDFTLDGLTSLVKFTGRMALSKIRENGEPRNLLSYAENVMDYAAKRQILTFLNKGASWAMNGRRVKDIIADMNVELSKVTIYGAEDEYTVPLSVAVSEAYDWTDQASQNKVVGVPTGLLDLDKILGSMIPGNVYIVAGRPGQGKTGLLLTIAKHAAQKIKKRVAVFSLEMSRQQVAQRLISQEIEVDLHRIILGKLLENEWPLFTHGVEVVSDFPIVINDLSSININQIRQTARKIKANGGLDLIVVDYIQLAGGDGGKYQNRELEVSSVSRGLKYLARELNVPILAAAQLSRAVEQRSNKTPIMSDLRESGSLENDAYAIIFINAPEAEDKQNIVQLIVAKHRNGACGLVDLVIKKSFVKFENASIRTFSPNRKDIE
jgi:replicative DNA helicase